MSSSSSAVPVERLRRLGNKGDGGYVVYMEEDDKECPWDLYVSAGVGAEESFTWDFLNYMGWGRKMRGQCWAFDGTVAAYPRQYIPKGCHIWFVAKNIGAHMTPTTVNLHRLIADHRDIFIKMDVEGAEYEWLLGLDPETQMVHIKQMVVEFHDINTAPTAQMFSSVWEHVQKTHKVVHIHGNNYGGIGGENGRPNVIEVTFVRICAQLCLLPKIAETEIAIWPIYGIDYSNDPTKPDLEWGGSGGDRAKN